MIDFIMLQSNYTGMMLVVAKQMGFMIGTFVVLIMGWIMYLKMSVGGGKRAYCQFIDPSGYQSTELLKIAISEAKPIVVSKVDDLPYFLDTTKQQLSMYPPGLPMWAREGVPLQNYVRGLAQPIDIRRVDTEALSPGSMAANLKLVKNMAFAGQMIENLQDELGIGGLSKTEKIMVFTILGLGVITGIAGFLTWQVYNSVEAIRVSIGIVAG